MKVVFQYIKDEDDSLMFIILRDERGKELMRVPVLVSNSDAEKLPQLKETLKTLPVLLKTLYKNGLNQQQVVFEEENVQI